MSRPEVRMASVIVDQQQHVPVGKRSVEYVERKGLGHPDTICDSVMESISVALSRAYLDAAGRVLHHNVDKGLLVAGQTTPKLGGGTVTAPMRLVVGDRATAFIDGRPIAVGDIVEQASRQWFREHLRLVDPAAHLVIQNELQPGSAELVGIFDPGRSGCPIANDTSAGVGFAPLTETERLVLAAERFLNSPDFKRDFPETGEDVKVMGVRRGRRLHMAVAMAMVDRFLVSPRDYFQRKAAARQSLHRFLASQLHTLDGVDVDLNTLDDETRGMEGMYLTVLGTSAEGGDGGQVGRGNRVNGLISLCRPMTLEAAAGKNPVSHVGKIYNLLAHHLAGRICASLEVVEEVYVWLCSQIGTPIDQPWFVSAEVFLKADANLQDVRRPIEELIQSEVAAIEGFSQRLARGEFPVC